MNVMTSVVTEDALTLRLAEQACETRFERLSAETVLIAKQCLLDYLGVTLAGGEEPASEIVYAEMAEQGGTPAATVFGRGARLPAASAALANGTASHALDFDDVNLAMPGHPTVAILPALLALGEEMGAGGAAILTAFVAGYELQCRLGRLIAPNHYDGGFHATGTVGTFGAAAACARLLQLSPVRTAQALGIAATQAAGLKSMFGTMCKPFHAGKAASNGLLAARLAWRGFESRGDAMETAQGFAATHSPDFHPEDALAEPPNGTYLRDNLFKYHAACYLTHATIEAASALRDAHRLAPDDVRAVRLTLDRSCEQVCNIAEPRTGLETKFSLRQTCAMALAGVDTAALASYSDANAGEDGLVALRRRVTTDFVSGWPAAQTEVEIELRDGRRVSHRHDAGVPAADIAAQGRKLAMKFEALAGPLLGRRAEQVAALVERFDQVRDVGELAQACG
ncbi:MAG: MmgE/PrpD family protein [Acetobacteraceae bacterium]